MNLNNLPALIPVMFITDDTIPTTSIPTISIPTISIPTTSIPTIFRNFSNNTIGKPELPYLLKTAKINLFFFYLVSSILIFSFVGCCLCGCVNIYYYETENGQNNIEQQREPQRVIIRVVTSKNNDNDNDNDNDSENDSL